ncbi:MAG: MarR family transcriptional regulator [Pseudobdellovibrionaceae bacterium]|jgi:DNA-binding MarR family transcriptional regulator|nr:MarR family transcriptional regulator [Pseudobdellovibrionaceae bacterium]
MNDQNTSAAKLLLTILYKLKEIDSEFPLQYAICLLEISKHEGCSLTDLSTKTGLALSTISRITGALSKFRQKGTPYGLIEMRISEIERRKKELYLTDKGRQTIKDLLTSF